MNFDIQEQLKKYNTKCLDLMTGLPPGMKTEEQIRDEIRQTELDKQRMNVLKEFADKLIAEKIFQNWY